MKRIIILAALTILTACSGGGGSGGSGGGSSTSTNKFTASGTPITADAMVSAYATSSIFKPLAVAQQDYYGRALMKDTGGTVYAAAFHFTLNKNDSSTAYFSDFYIDYMTEITGYATSTDVVTSPTLITLTSNSYNAMTNSVSIANASSRFVNFNIDFSNNPYLSSISNAGVIFTNDFNTMVGGDNASFFFIAQKASSLPTVSAGDLLGTFKLVNFSISGAGSIAIDSTSTVKVEGTGGSGYTAFTGQDSQGNSFQGELTLNNANTGALMFGYDNNGGTPPTVTSSYAGAFLFAPDKSCVLGYDTASSLFFAASK